MKIVHKYGLLPPYGPINVVYDQLYKANRYRNELTSIEIDKREKLKEIRASIGSDVLWEEVLELGKEKKRIGDKIKASKDKEEHGKLEDQFDKVDKKIKEVRSLIREIEDSSQEIVELLGKKIGEGTGKRDNKVKNNGQVSKAIRAARSVCGVYSGTYLKVEAASRQSSQKTVGDKTPAYKRWKGEGGLSVQITGTYFTKDIFEDNIKKVSIAPVDNDALLYGSRGERRKAARTWLRMQVAGKRNNGVEYMEWPMIYHRPLPPNARLRWVTVNKCNVGSREKWSCDITFEVPDVEPAIREHALAIVFGWRKTYDGYRVAHWLSTSGKSGYLDMLEGDLSMIDTDGGYGGVVDGLEKAESLQSIRDKIFVKVVSSFANWLSERDMPEWIYEMLIDRVDKEDGKVISKREAISYLRKWESQRRLVVLVKKWKFKRFEDDYKMYNLLSAWLHKDSHLWNWQESERKGSIGRRRDRYRCFAANLADEYGPIIADGTDYSRLKESKEYVVGQKVAVGELRGIIKNAASMRGVSFLKMESANTAIKCPNCDTVDKAHKGHYHIFACSNCPLIRDTATVRMLNMFKDKGYGEFVKDYIDKGEKFSAQLEEKMREERSQENE